MRDREKPYIWVDLNIKEIDELYVINGQIDVVKLSKSQQIDLNLSLFKKFKSHLNSVMFFTQKVVKPVSKK